jgi:hypothetical protein
MTVIIWTNWKLSREPFGTSWPKGGSVCSVWRMNTVEKWKEQLAGRRYMRNETRKEEI